MTVTLTGKIVAIMAIVAILILGFGYRKYKKITDSILREQDRQLRDLKRAIELADMTIGVWKQNYENKEKELEKYKRIEEARKLDEKMLLPTTQNKNENLEF